MFFSKNRKKGFFQILTVTLSFSGTDMRLYFFLAVTLMTLLTEVVHGAEKKKLQIGIKKRVENCPIKSRKGDVLNMHYTVGFFELSYTSIFL